MTPDKKKDEAAIREWIDKYIGSVISGDLDTYLASWSDDVIFLPPNQPAKIGKEACREIAEGILLYDIEADLDIQEIKISGDLAFTRNLARETFTPKNGDEPFDVELKSIYMFKRQSDGSWIGTHCIWNTNPT